MPTNRIQNRAVGVARRYIEPTVARPPAMFVDQSVRAYLNPITDETEEKEIPPTMGGVIVYHNHSRRFYSTVVSNPFAFRRKMLSQTSEYYSLSKALRILLAQHPDFEFYYVHERARNAVEHMLCTHGFRRVTTTKGEMQEEIPHLFSVTDTKNSFTRWVIAPRTIDDYYLLKKINSSFRDWANNGIDGRVPSSQASKRKRVLMILGYDFFKRPGFHFNPDEVLIHDHGKMIINIKDYAAETTQRNDYSVTEFLKAR